MKTIKIMAVSLENFKGQKDRQTVEFETQGVTVIEGVNYSGKTTLLDAITWCLFGKTLEGDTRFDITPNDRPDAVPEVELKLIVDDVQHTLLRKSVKGKADCYIDEVPKPVKTFEAWVNANVLPIERFKMFSNPLHFASLNWKDQRQIFTSFFEKPQKEQIITALAESDKELSEIFLNQLEKLSSADIAIKAKNDIYHLERHQNMDQAVANDLTDKINAADNTPVDKLKEECEMLQQRRKGFADQQTKEAEERTKYHTCVHNVQRLEYDISNEKRKLERECEERLNQAKRKVQDCKRELESQINEWNKVLAAGYSDTCPVCKQTLPVEDAEQNKKLFEKNKAKVTADGNKAKKELDAATTELKEIEAKEPLTSVRVIELQNELKEAKKAVENLPQLKAPVGQEEFSKIQERMDEISFAVAAYDRLQADIKQRDGLVEDIKARGVKLEAAQRLVKDAKLWDAYESKVTVDQVNKRFENAHVELFEQQKNGVIKDTFKLYWKGTSYQGTSSTEKVLIGFEINAFLKEALQISSPTLIDNFERYSSIGLDELPVQSIVTVVTSDKELIKNGGYIVKKGNEK